MNINARDDQPSVNTTTSPPHDVRYTSKCEGRLATFGDFPNLLATINCHSSAVTAAFSATSSANSPPPTSAPIIRSNRQQGPVLLEIMQVQRRSNDSQHNRRSYASTDDSLELSLPPQWSTYPVARSRSNPSLGTSLASTCLDVMPTAPVTYTYSGSGIHDLETAPPSPVATGLTTGALCLHTFAPSSSDESSPSGTDWVPRLEFYQSPTRYHRPATCVAWRHALQDQQSVSQMIAIGLVASSSAPSASSLPPAFPASDGSDPSRASRAPSTALGGRVHGASVSATDINDPLYQGDSPVTTREVKLSGQGIGDAGGLSYLRPNPPTSRSHRGGAVVSGGMASLSTGTYAGGANASVGATDREYCCLLWDVEHQSSPAADSQAASSSGNTSAWSLRRTSVPANGRSTPLHKLSHQMGVASLAWLMDGNVLACGGQLRSLQLYDMRGAGGGGSSGGVAAPVSVLYAHNFAVQVKSDPNRPWLLASFCRSPSEPVKIWDCRRMDSTSGPVSEIKMKPTDYTSYVSAVQWSSMEAGRLIVAIGNTFHEYDVLSSSASAGGNFGTGSGSGLTSSSLRSNPVQTLYAKDLIADFCLPAFDKRIMAVSPGGNPTVFDTVRFRFDTPSAVAAMP
jgi:hypothetical protein